MILLMNVVLVKLIAKKFHTIGIVKKMISVITPSVYIALFSNKRVHYRKLLIN